MTSPSEKVIAVIPAYNEGKTVAKVVRELKLRVEEVIVVNDCSTDNTASEAAQAGATVLTHEKNGGYDKSIDDGFKEAVKQNATIIFTIDADGEHAVEDVPRLLAPLLEGSADITAGQRPHLAHVAEKIFALYTNARYGVYDPLCGFKAYRRAVYDGVGHFDAIQSIGTELMLKGVAKGFKLALVPIELRTRTDDTSRFYSRNFRANIKIFKALLRVMTS